jgi:hypothetical protein
MNDVARANAPKLDEVLRSAEALGEQAGLGRDVQVKFDLKVFEAAYTGALSLTRDKNGIDDAVRLAEAYFRGRNKSVIFDHTEPKQRKLAATVRTMIKLGSCPKWGHNEPMHTMNALLTLRQSLRKVANKGRRLDDAHNTLMRFAREQLKRDTAIPTDELEAFCFRPESEPRTAVDWLRAVCTQASALRIGKLSNCSDVDNSPEVNAIIAACNKRLADIASGKH